MPPFDPRLAADYPAVIGCDEVGRGALCGPVMVAAVWFDPVDVSRRPAGAPRRQQAPEGGRARGADAPDPRACPRRRGGWHRARSWTGSTCAPPPSTPCAARSPRSSHRCTRLGRRPRSRAGPRPALPGGDRRRPTGAADRRRLHRRQDPARRADAAAGRALPGLRLGPAMSATARAPTSPASRRGAAPRITA